MDLTPHMERLRYELGVAAVAAGDDARALAVRLTAALGSAVRLVPLEALPEAADEISRKPRCRRARRYGTARSADTSCEYSCPSPSARWATCSPARKTCC